MQNAHQNTHKTNCAKVKQRTKPKSITYKKGEFAGDIATFDR